MALAPLKQHTEQLHPAVEAFAGTFGAFEAWSTLEGPAGGGHDAGGGS
ncbi:MAG: hypothetical protein U0790_19305 [Isosphaeraceae bacterium]